MWVAVLNFLNVLILCKIFFFLSDFKDIKKCFGKSASNTACLTDIAEAVDLFFAITSLEIRSGIVNPSG